MPSYQLHASDSAAGEVTRRAYCCQFEGFGTEEST
jgi:hypothetical protein